ncbi:MAG: hypothetical protein A2846_01675 [Candidatus Doudnabacteria bacterium RIFCSPHIGHO2_01_FULL_49_9]|uniref:Sortase n=1 Tax=Candidatus Doudnabacteria bacterium RIFCSPHIGHO2_01_FULL_49_9 TaxID=1817827 RepID=A0A1F5P2F6_9BACT|nr:MAG: hypothetical protein A2846_01675 [Candidatus Doudnabacteria bacterium RIFCSPHIGHO2_01_FULL_49_9]
MSIRKKLLLLILAAAVVWVALNFDYLRKNVAYELSGPPETQNPTSTQPEIPANPNPPPSNHPLPQGDLTVTSLGISVPVLYAERVDENHFQALLINGVVHYPGTAEIGQIGNPYIFGHSSDNAWSKGKYKTIFAVLPKIKIGAEIFISDRAGQQYTYKVIDARVVNKNDISVLSQDTGGRKILTLQTSYPVGTSLKRYVVVAELTE